MSELWKWTVEGAAADDQAFICSGDLTADIAVDGAKFIESALRGTFAQLTHSKAVFGRPGVGCRGPYTTTRVVFER